VPAAWTVDPLRNIIAGVVAGIVSLPLAMGFGALAVSPLGPQYVSLGVLAGLYGAAYLGLIALIAGARGVAIYGPRGLVSFVIASACADVLVGADWLPMDDPMAVMSALFLVMAMAGVFQLLFAVLRVPRMVKFIPTPVMAGFQNAAAIAIVASQLHVLLGLAEKPALDGWISALADIRPLQLLLGALTLVLIFQGQRLLKKVPPLVTALVLGTLAYYALAFAGFSAGIGEVLGKIEVRVPDGRELAGILALTQAPGFGQALPGLMIAAFSIAVVASLDVMISAKVVENLAGQRGNSTREMYCVGMANAVAPLLGGIAGTISLGPTTTNYRSGARNSLSLLAHALLFVMIILVLSPLVGLIPKVVIAALVLYAGIQLFDRWSMRLLKQMLRFKSVNWQHILIDLAVIVMVTLAALLRDAASAVGIGIVIAVMVFAVRMSQGMVRSVRFGDVMHSRRTREAADIEALSANGRQILVLELEGALFFASAEQLHNRIDAALADRVHYVVLDIARVNEIDSTGAQILVQTAQRMKAAGAQMVLSGKEEASRTLAVLRDHGAADVLTRERVFPDMDRALEWCENHLLQSLRSRVGADGDHAFAQIDIVQGLSGGEQESVRALMQRREYPAGEAIFRQGEEGDALYIILRGSASVHMRLPAGDVRLVTFSPGTVFGEMALLDRERRSATVTADEPLACFVLERARFDRLRAEHPRIALAILANMAREMSLRMRRANRSLIEQG